MMERDAIVEQATSHPLDVGERIVDGNEWTFERRNDREMAVQAPGRWCEARPRRGGRRRPARP